MGWRETVSIYMEPASIRMLLLGFSSGLPLLLVLGTLSFWLREAGIDRTTIGYLSWIGLAYGFKWAWAPLVDRMPIPGLTNWLGRRRGWLLLGQVGVIAGLICMARTDPSGGAVHTLVWAALLVAFSSATQDIALDAFRIESAAPRVQAALSASYQTGYRIAMIWAGAGVLWVAARVQGPEAGYDAHAWHVAYLVMAASMAIGVLTTLASREPHRPDTRVADAQTVAQANGLQARGWPRWAAQTVAWLTTALVRPFAEFLGRYRWQAVLVLGLIALYRISDVVMGIMANPFYVDMGYTKDQVAAVSKVFGLIMTLAGAFLGGALSLRLGVMRVLLLGAVLSAATNLLFAWLAGHGTDFYALVAVVSADNLSGGIASAAFIAYLSGLTNVSYSATQYALFSSLMLLFPKWLAGFSGAFVDHFGYAPFFVGTALLGVPVVILVLLASRVHVVKPAPQDRPDKGSS